MGSLGAARNCSGRRTSLTASQMQCDVIPHNLSVIHARPFSGGVGAKGVLKPHGKSSTSARRTRAPPEARCRRGAGGRYAGRVVNAGEEQGDSRAKQF